MAITRECLESLGQKLEALSLTTGEQEALDVVLSRAAAHDDEVSGFMFDPLVTTSANKPVGSTSPTWSTKLFHATGFADLDNVGDGFTER